MYINSVDIPTSIFRDAILFLKQRAAVVHKRILISLSITPTLFEKKDHFKTISIEKYIEIRLLLIDKSAHIKLKINFVNRVRELKYKYIVF